MAHLNYFTRVVGVNFCFFIAAPSGGGCWYYAKCEMRMLLCKIDGEKKMQNCGYFTKLRRWRHAPRLTATTVVMDSRCLFSKRWHVANVKSITGNDQTTLIVYRNFEDIEYTFRFYICLCLRDRDCCSAADGNSSCRGLAPSFFEEMTCCRRQKHHRRWSRSIEILQLPKFMPTRSSKPSQKHLFAARMPPLWCHCALFFPTVTCNGFCSHLRKIISQRPWPPPPKNWDMHIEEFFFRFYL